MPDKLISALSRALWDTNMVTSRILLAIAEFLWGMLLLWPGDTFGRPTYNGMAHVMPEDCWGFVFLATSAMQIRIVEKEDFHSREARYFATYNMILWVFVVLSMLNSVYPPPAAISGEIALAMAAWWIWFRPFLLCKWILNARASIKV